MLITVAICTWNRSKLLDQTLTEMAKLEIPAGTEWELLVVNNNSTDDTDDVIAAHSGKLPTRRLLEKKQGHSNARNCALDHAKGDWIAWTDDDVLVDPKWLVGLCKGAGRLPEAAAIGGPIAPWFVTDPDPDLVATFPPLRSGYCGVDHGADERILNDDEDIFARIWHSTCIRHERFALIPVTAGVEALSARLTMGCSFWQCVPPAAKSRGPRKCASNTMSIRHAPR